MTDPNREARHKFLNNAVTMAEACLLGCMETSASKANKFSEEELNKMAGLFSGLVSLFSVRDTRDTVELVKSERLRGGTFKDGGRVIVFIDGRQPLEDLVMTRTAFKAALQILKDSGLRST